ncbi:hypothetical protein [Prosthecobacter sp.]|uniref:hypothetical protein n=1 Tax=Prosthecobacter sp. TaxID=1965333 RepID=UPI001D63674D|nr:hypothetical protein [Prosthecobacter sp.]MCB1275983.1 hypothetical protein [Prosthecobacter sp.]
MSEAKASQHPALTLKERVAWFWDWFSSCADRLHATLEDKKGADLQEETSAVVEAWLPHMAWVYGPGENNSGHSFTLSGEAVLAKQFVAEYWLSQAPKIDGWTFFASRQPSDSFEGISLHFEKDDETFKPIEFWIFPYVNKDSEKIDISVWHPSIKRLPEKARFMALFLMLDELLGEHGTQNWIGEIKFSEDQLRQSIPIAELRDLIDETRQEHGWKKYPPTEAYTSYRLKEQGGDWLRSDTVAGSSRLFRLLGDYVDAEGPCEHPLPDVGVDFVFVAIPTAHFPQGAQVAARGEIEDDLIAALEADASGISLGGATGHKHCYIDLALYDGDRSLEIVKRVLRKHRVPKQTEIHFFTTDRGEQAISV